MTEKDKNAFSDRKYYLFALRIMGEFIYVIAVPIVLLAFLGKWVDSKIGTSPKFMILGFFVAAFISGWIIWRRAKELGKEYQDLDKKS